MINILTDKNRFSEKFEHMQRHQTTSTVLVKHFSIGGESCYFFRLWKVQAGTDVCVDRSYCNTIRPAWYTSRIVIVSAQEVSGELEC